YSHLVSMIQGMEDDASESFPILASPISKEIKAEVLLEKIRSSSFHLHIIILVCSLSWAVGCIAFMSSAFYDVGNRTMTTVSEEFELGENSPLREFASSSFMIGTILGGAISSPIADRIGRRPVMLACTIGVSIMFVLVSFAPSIHLFIAGRFLQGFCFSGSVQTSWVLAFESIPIKLRAPTAFVFGAANVVGYCSVLPMSMMSSTWRQFMQVCAVPIALYAIIAFVFIPESLHWLVANGRTKEIKKKWLSKIDEPVSMPASKHQEEDGSQPRSILVSYIKTHKIILALIVAVGLIWLSDNFIFLGLSMYSTDLAGDYRLNYLMLGLVELPGYALTHVVLERFSRRFVMCSTHLASALAFLILIAIPPGSQLSLACWMIGKLSITIAYMSVFLVGCEIFPTQLRNSVIGICGLIAGLGLVLAPYVKTLSRISPVFPLIAFGSFAILAGLISLALPETKDKSLDDTETTETERKEEEVAP
ncbi:hypothetical protein PENTCL1PPCAC_270, partial [Pristionchus entomophagus]